MAQWGKHGNKLYASDLLMIYYVFGIFLVCFMGIFYMLTSILDFLSILEDIFYMLTSIFDILLAFL